MSVKSVEEMWVGFEGKYLKGVSAVSKAAFERAFWFGAMSGVLAFQEAGKLETATEAFDGFERVEEEIRNKIGSFIKKKK